MDNKVLLIGTNHHNILGLVRSFGVNCIYPYGLIVGDGATKSFVRKSKYWTKTWAIDSEDEMIDFMLKQFENEELRPVVIPCSDLLAEIIDLNYNRLKDKYILPSINNEQGKIAELMDKQRQVELAKKYDIPMAKSWVIDLKNETIPDDIVYPCIVKPVVSAEGKKSDIRKCIDEKELIDYLMFLCENKYERILIQEFINFDYEISFIGSISEKTAYLINKKIRIWPIVGGSNSFVNVNKDKYMESFCLNILDILKKIKYIGLFDVEILCSGNQIYLNEINWRNSGNSFFALGTNVFYATIWYYMVINKTLPNNLKLTNNDNDFFAMDESKDLRYVVIKRISLKEWIADVKRSKCFAIWYSRDLKPTIYRYCGLIREFIKRKGI